MFSKWKKEEKSNREKRKAKRKNKHGCRLPKEKSSKRVENVYFRESVRDVLFYCRFVQKRIRFVLKLPKNTKRVWMKCGFVHYFTLIKTVIWGKRLNISSNQDFCYIQFHSQIIAEKKSKIPSRSSFPWKKNWNDINVHMQSFFHNNFVFHSRSPFSLSLYNFRQRREWKICSKMTSECLSCDISDGKSLETFFILFLINDETDDVRWL